MIEKLSKSCRFNCYSNACVECKDNILEFEIEHDRKKRCRCQLVPTYTLYLDYLSNTNNGVDRKEFRAVPLMTAFEKITKALKIEELRKTQIALEQQDFLYHITVIDYYTNLTVYSLPIQNDDITNIKNK